LAVAGWSKITSVGGHGWSASKLFTTEKKGEDEEITEEDQDGAARGVCASTEVSMAMQALVRTPREALKNLCFSVCSSSSLSSPW
jgi:hypothetical protein